MFDFGDDIILNNFRIPWLIWIQILVMFLLTLTILLSYFGFFALETLDSSSSSSTNSLTSNSNSPLLKISSTKSPITQQAGENHDSRSEIVNTTSNRVRHVRNNSGRDGSFMKDLVPSPVTERLFHPCRFFNLAKDAFLKCLGLGSGSQHSSDEEHED